MMTLRKRWSPLLAILALSPSSCVDSSTENQGDDSFKADTDPGGDDSVVETAESGDSEQVETADSERDLSDLLPNRLEVVDGRDLLHLYGSRYDMGYAEGAILCGRFTSLFEDYMLETFIALTGVDYGLISAYILGIVEIPEGDLQEMQGILDGVATRCGPQDLIVESPFLEESAKGSRAITLNDLIVSNSLADFSCSSFTVWGSASATGSSLAARNFDYIIDDHGSAIEETMVKVYHSDQEGAAFASVTFPGLVGCVSCFSQAGLGVTMHDVSPLEATQDRGIVPRILATRAALAWASSLGGEDPAADFETVLETSPAIQGNNLHFSMPCEGVMCEGAVVFEYDGDQGHPDGQVSVRHGERTDLGPSNFIAATNHYLLRRDPPDSGGSLSRYDTLVQGISAFGMEDGGMDADDALSLISTVASEGTLHTTIWDQASNTLTLRVAPGRYRPATEGEPMLLDLTELLKP